MTMRFTWVRLTTAVVLSAALIGGFAHYEHPLDEMALHAYNSSPHHEKAIAITLDDGPHPIMTPLLLDILKRYHAKVTFFTVGMQAEEYPDLIRRISAAGNQVGCHTYSHHNLTEMSAHEAERELIYWERDVDHIIGRQPRFLRPPGGDFNRDTISLLRRRGYSLALWSVNPGDWRMPAPEKIVNYVMGHVHPGDIVLMHDDGLPTIIALPTILEGLQAKGYKLVTVQELVTGRP